MNLLLENLLDVGNIGRVGVHKGLIELKPFREWIGSSFCHKKFTMRLLNAGEMEDVLTYLSNFPSTVYEQKLRVELFIRSVWAIDGVVLCRAEDLLNWNENRETEPDDEMGYLRKKIRDMEQNVLERFEVLYTGLSQKQMRQLMGLWLCGSCKSLLKKKTEGFVRTQYDLAEGLCKSCFEALSEEQKNSYDFLEGSYKPKPAVPAMVQQQSADNGINCRYCGEKFSSYDEVDAHIAENCMKVELAGEPYEASKTTI